MPVREKTVNNLLDGLIGSQWFKFGECQSMNDKEYRVIRNLVDAIFVRIVDYTDWNRVLLEASARHIALDHKEAQSSGLSFDIDNVCGECITEALLNTSYDPWENQPAKVVRDPHNHGLLPPGHGNQPRPPDNAAQLMATLAYVLGIRENELKDEE